MNIILKKIKEINISLSKGFKIYLSKIRKKKRKRDLRFRLPLPHTVDAVEALATTRALVFAQEIGVSSVILEGNSPVVINSLERK